MYLLFEYKIPSANKTCYEIIKDAVRTSSGKPLSEEEFCSLFGKKFLEWLKSGKLEPTKI